MTNLHSEYKFLNTKLEVSSENERLANRLHTLISLRIGHFINYGEYHTEDGEVGNGLKRTISDTYHAPDSSAEVTIKLEQPIDFEEAKDYAERKVDVVRENYIRIIQEAFNEYEDHLQIMVPSGELTEA